MGIERAFLDGEKKQRFSVIVLESVPYDANVKWVSNVLRRVNIRIGDPCFSLCMNLKLHNCISTARRPTVYGNEFEQYYFSSTVGLSKLISSQIVRYRGCRNIRELHVGEDAKPQINNG